MTRKRHNHTPKTHELETQNTNKQMPPKCYQIKATSCLFPSKMIEKLETILSTAQQNKRQTQTPTK